MHGSSTWSSCFGPFIFKPEIDLGNVLTVITLAGALVGWLWLSSKEWRAKNEDKIKSGALRLLLYILRADAGAKPISLADLKARFNSPELKERRKAYCGRDWTFKTDPEFEAAIYRLDWEMKIEWVAADQIKFRVRGT
jgi:hypothetical protein